MKLAVVVAALVASIVFAAPADAAVKKKRKQVAARAGVTAVQSQPGAHPYDVYVSGEYIGRDPDPAIRSYMIRYPHIWDGPN